MRSHSGARNAEMTEKKARVRTMRIWLLCTWGVALLIIMPLTSAQCFCTAVYQEPFLPLRLEYLLLPCWKPSPPGQARRPDAHVPLLV